ncbi:MAG: hypothetical protein ACOX9E_02445 [Lentisphaeria bacterium]
MLKSIVWLVPVLIALTSSSCVTTPPAGPKTSINQWQCLGSNSNEYSQQLPLAPFPLMLQTPDGSLNDEKYGPATAVINAYREQWLRAVPSLQEKTFLEELCQAPAAQRLNSVKALLTADFFAATDKQLTQALATTPQLNPTQKNNLETVILQHQHMKLLFDAALARDQLWENPTTAQACLTTVRRLHRLREVMVKTHPDYIETLRADEKAAGDWAAENWTALFADAEPTQPLPAIWLLATDSARSGIQQDWGKRLIDDWRSATPRLLHLNAGPAPADSSACEQACWLIQTMVLPEKHGEIAAYINFLALPGRCSLFFNGLHVGQKDNKEAESCRFQLQPFAPQHNEQTIAIYFPDGCPKQYPFPIWISSSPLK